MDKELNVFEFHQEHLSAKEIIEQKLFHVFIVGFRKAGLSLMADICAALGVTIVEAVLQNQDSHEPLISEGQFRQFFDVINTPYSGLLLSIPVVGYNWQLIEMLPSKVIVVRRDIDTMLAECTPKLETEVWEGRKLYMRTAFAQQIVWLRHGQMEHCVVDYESLIDQPREIISEVKQFIHSDQSIEKAVELVMNKEHVQYVES